MTAIIFVPATLEHAREIAPRIVAGPTFCALWRKRGMTSLEAAEEAIRLSPHAWAGYGDGQLGALIGIVPQSMTSDKAMPWMLPTELVKTHARSFLRTSKQFIAEARTLYPELYGFVDTDNDASIKWLEWLGFKIEGGSDFRAFG